MKNQTQTQTQTSSSAEGAAEVTPFPSRRYKELYIVEDRPDGRGGFWTKIGVAFETKNGHWSLKLAALPVGNGRIIMMDPKPKENVAERDQRVAA